MECKKEHRYNEAFNNWSNNQAGIVRHKSPHAAYAQGYLDGINVSNN